MVKENKKIYFEVMRILACFFVIFTHTRTDGYFLFSTYEVGRLPFFINMIFPVFAKFSVAIFFAISGALLLNKNETIKDVLKKRVLKTVLMLVCWSLVYYMIEVFKTSGNFNFVTFVSKLYSSNWNYTYWYIYAYIGFLLALPFMRKLVQNMTNKEFIYMFVLAFIFIAVLPLMQYFLGIGKMNSNINFSWLTTRSFFYPCLGYFLEHRVDIKKVKKYIPVLWTVNIFTLVITCFLTYMYVKKTGVCYEGKSQVFFWYFVMINCTTLFVTIKHVFTTIKLNDFISKLIISLGKSTLGIYLMHLMFVKSSKVRVILEFCKNTLGINAMISCLIYCLVIMLICYILTLVIRKIPLINKVV